MVATADWHPLGHISFASTHEGKKVNDRIEANGITQNLWPVHCVAGTPGADFHPVLDIDRADLILRKEPPSISIRTRPFSKTTERPLPDFMAICKPAESIRFSCGPCPGLVCLFSALDALALGYKTTILQDLCRPVDQPAGFSDKRVGELRMKGVLVSTSESLI